jgi:dinuclear metal center YbgI/SA1388 family protein
VSPTVAEITAVAESLWPVAGAEEWDAVGLVSGAPDSAVSHIHLTVDAVIDTAREAIDLGAQLLLAHHPLLLRGVTSIAEDRYKGAVLSTLVRGGCALLTAHTNADVVETGTSAIFADKLGLLERRAIVIGDSPTSGVGAIGRLAEPISLGRLARLVAELLPATAGGVRVAGEYDTPVSAIALVAGAGDAYLREPEVLAADVFITSDLRHHPASAAREDAVAGGGPALIDVSHWASEWLWLDTAAEQLRSKLAGLTVTVSELRTDPWDFVIVQ